MTGWNEVKSVVQTEDLCSFLVDFDARDELDIISFFSGSDLSAEIRILRLLTEEKLNKINSFAQDILE